MARINAQALATSAPTDTNAPPTGECIDYYKAVVEARDILAQVDAAERGYYRLGQLAYEVAEAAEYGDRTLAKFADDVGVAKCTIDRYANVYRSWKGILAPGPKLPQYSVLRELAPHSTDPEVAKIVQDNPDITKRNALDLKSELKHAVQEKQQREKENDWLKDNRRGFRELYTHAEEAFRAVDVWLDCTPEKQRELLQAIDTLMLMDLRAFGRMLVRFADHFEQLLEEDEAAKKTEAGTESAASTATATAHGAKAETVTAHAMA